MRQALLALACIWSIGVSSATANDLLDLGTRDLAETKTPSGIALVFDPGKIIMVYALPGATGLSRTRSAPITNVIGLAGGPQEIDEPADGLLERLNLKPFFVALTLPDGIGVWVKASAVSYLRATEPWDHTRAEAKSFVNTGGRPIFVKESVASIKDAINAIRRQNRPR
jgi:hypothetical protein